LSKIILLNGCSSCGKTTIAKAIQYLSNEPWLHTGVDDLINMMPSKFVGFGEKADSGYYKLIAGKNEFGQTMQVKIMPKGRKIFDLFPEIVKKLADSGENIIIDEVLFNKKMFDIYFEKLKSHKIFLIGIFCDLKIMQERELLRGNRCLGLSNYQFEFVHKNLKELYDLTFDTANSQPFELAQKILEAVKT
jgi:chloramphenicol 3-O phosphotransferase